MENSCLCYVLKPLYGEKKKEVSVEQRKSGNLSLLNACERKEKENEAEEEREGQERNRERLREMEWFFYQHLSRGTTDALLFFASHSSLSRAGA